MRIFSIVFISFIFPTVVFSNDSVLKDKLVGTKWKIVKINGKSLPDDTVDIEFTFDNGGKYTCNSLEEFFLGKDKPAVIKIKKEWFCENNQVTLVGISESDSEALKQKIGNLNRGANLNKVKVESEFKAKVVFKIQFTFNDKNIEEIKNSKGQMIAYSEIVGKINGLSLDKKLDYGPVLLKFIFEGLADHKDYAISDSTMKIKPLDILLEKTK